MNRAATHQTLHSPTHTSYRQIMEMAKALSRDKSQEARRYSRSPKQQNQHGNVERKTETEQYRHFQLRYKELEDKYRELLEMAKQRGVEHEKMKEEIKRYQKTHERDTLQIQRLRCIIGLIKKRSVSIQVEEDQLDSSGPSGSRLNKFDQSTEDQIKLKNSAEKLHSRERLSPYKQLHKQKDELVSWQSIDNQVSQTGIYMKNKNKMLLNQTGKEFPITKYSRDVRESIVSNKKLSNSPYSRLRFVPATTYK